MKIVRGALPPGASRDENRIARRFKWSRTPVPSAAPACCHGPVDALANIAARWWRGLDRAANRMFERWTALEARCAVLPRSDFAGQSGKSAGGVSGELAGGVSYAANPDRLSTRSRTLFTRHRCLFSQNANNRRNHAGTRVGCTRYPRRQLRQSSATWQNRTPESRSRRGSRSCAATAIGRRRPRCAPHNQRCAHIKI